MIKFESVRFYNLERHNRINISLSITDLNDILINYALIVDEYKQDNDIANYNQLKEIQEKYYELSNTKAKH